MAREGAGGRSKKGGRGRVVASRAARSDHAPSREEVAASGETPVDRLAEAVRSDRRDLGFLGREFLSWLVFHAEAEGGEFAGAGDVEPFVVRFGGKLSLQTLAGQVTEMTLKGASPGSSADVRYGLAGGLGVKEAELVLEQGEATYGFVLGAEHFDLKRVKLPEVLGEGEGEIGPVERADERLRLLTALDAALEHAFGHFLSLRCQPAWEATVLPALRAWLDDGT